MTVSGLSAALVLIMLALAQYSPVAKISFFALAGVCLLLPCVADSLWSLCMAFLAGGGLAVLFNPVNVIPFVLFFGLHIILVFVCRKYLKDKWFICIPLKLVVLEVGIYGIYKLYGISYVERIFESLNWTYNYWFVLLITIPFVILYDYAIRMIWNILNRKLNKIVCKYTDRVKKINAQPDDSNGNIERKPDENDLFDDNDIFDDKDGNGKDNDENKSI